MKMTCKIAVALLFFAALAGGLGKAPKLAPYNVDKALLSVSGLSSGGFFAVQFHVAFSATIMGAGIVAGGPFFCAQDNLDIALSACTKSPELISVDKLIAITYTTALGGTIDKPSHLSSDRVYLFSGSLDSIVNPGVMKKLAQYYSSFVTKGDVYSMFSIPAEHAMVTDNYGHNCSVFSSPFINNCHFPLAYDILNQIYQDVQPADHSLANPSNLMEFDQSEFFADLPGAVDMDSTGFIYVPTKCQNKTVVCRLHAVFHGCRQGRKYVSNEYALHAGYNAVAELNNIILLYPQATNSTYNPKGCWDWWGYTSTAYSSKLGPQIAGVKLMLDRIVY
ncbi:poly(3-hydroxybutyrate) depolymerase-like [Halichondria panicea]|uniref:poly(3-hydroxybutyrate) depolymerase-like n=1 Tax=Halichondria panicea TaxID=6063 RepID=UPI00312BBC60